MIAAIIENRRTASRSVLAIIGLFGLTTSVAGQAAEKQDEAKVDRPASTSPTTPEASVEERLRKMEEAYRRIEETNKRIQGQYDGLLKKYDELKSEMNADRNREPKRAPSATTRPASRVGAVEYQGPGQEVREGLGARGMGGRTAPGANGVGAPRVEGRGALAPAAGTTSTSEAEAAEGEATPPGAESSGVVGRAAQGIGARGTGGRVSPSEAGYRGEEAVPRRPAKVEFAEGLELSSPDDEFKLTFHNMTQLEYRAFPHSEEGLLHSQFFVPRQRWYFTGRVTRNIEFYTSINRGYGSLDVLDAFLSYRLGERLQFRVGRMKTPYLYEYFSIAEGDLIAPERSIYAGNLAGNRQDGAMALGELFEGRLGYAVGIFNGPRNSFQDYNGAKDTIGYINSRPFLTSEALPALKYLNIGGSFEVGYQNNPVQPSIITTSNDETAATSNPTVESLSPTILAFNNNVVEQGQRNQWAAHAVWYYKSMMLLAEYGGGVAGYALTNSKTSTYIPFSGYNVSASYFLTGEELTRRVSMIKPKQDFSIFRGKWAPGAWEVYARYSELDFSKEIFTAGFSDPNNWSTHAWATDVGLNWYLNFYTRIYLDWQHSEFGNPVVVAPNRAGNTRDLYWIRFQLFF